MAGLEPQYGLYSAFMGCFVYIVFGSSKDITIGPTAIMALMTGGWVIYFYCREKTDDRGINSNTGQVTTRCTAPATPSSSPSCPASSSWRAASSGEYSALIGPQLECWPLIGCAPQARLLDRLHLRAGDRGLHLRRGAHHRHQPGQCQES